MSDIFVFDGSLASFGYSNISSVGESYMGNFKVKTMLSPMDFIKADRLYRELIGSTTPHLATETTKSYCFALSQLKVRIVESPDFFKNQELDGSNLPGDVLIEILNKAIEAEAKYKKDVENRMRQMQENLTKKIKNKEIQLKDEDDSIDLENDLPEINENGEIIHKD